MVATFPAGLHFLSCYLSCPKAKLVIFRPYKVPFQAPKLTVLFLSLWVGRYAQVMLITDCAFDQSFYSLSASVVSDQISLEEKYP